METGRYLKIEITPDEMEAHLTISLPRESPQPKIDEIINALKEKEVAEPIMTERIEEMLKKKYYNKPVVVAKGKPAVMSKNGFIDLLYKKDEPETDPNARVDHHYRESIPTVSKGEEIARLQPPIQGTEGKTVTGKTISPGTGKERVLKSGKNTEFSTYDKNLLLSTENGVVRFADSNKIQVDPVMNVRGDVDFSVGNIDFTGALVIRGNVLSGFKVKAAGAIQIDGIVEDSEVIAGGDIIVNSCSGKQKGLLRSGGSIKINFAENHTIQAMGDITVNKYLINCKIHADGKVIITNKKGVIVGGETIASRGIETPNAGNLQGTKTVLAAGFSSELRQKLVMLDIEQTKNIKSLGTVDQALKRISRIAIIKKELAPEIKNQIKELLHTREIIEERISKLTEEQSACLAETEDSEQSYIKVTGTINPGVTVRFPNSQRIVRSSMVNSKIIMEQGNIKILSAN